MKNRLSIVPASELESLLRETDSLRVALRGHQGVENLVNFFLLEVLPNPDVTEVGRLQFGLKVDLLVAMGHLRTEDRPGFEKLDLIRNRFAHRHDAEVSEDASRDIVNVLSPVQRKMLGEFGPEPVNPRQTVAALALILHSQLWMAARNYRDSRISYEYSAKRLRDVLDHVTRRTGEDAVRELDERLRQSRLEREARGEP